MTCKGVVFLSKALDDLLELLDLEELEVNIFRGRSPDEDRQRVFGGQVAGQALVAAYRTVEKGFVHSLHAYFLLAGDPSVPILYQVDRVRDGRTFSTRRVSAIQKGRPIFILSASFQPVEEGPEHQIAMPEAPGPEGLPTWEERIKPLLEKSPPALRKWLTRERPFDGRSVDPSDFLQPKKRPPHKQVWLRAKGTLPPDPMIHQALFAYASDITLLDTSTLPHGISIMDDAYQMASLDHAMWFHRPFRMDEWLLYEQESPSAYGARAFTRGDLFTRDGQLVVSVTQEGLLRRRATK